MRELQLQLHCIFDTLSTFCPPFLFFSFPPLFFFFSFLPPLIVLNHICGATNDRRGNGRVLELRFFRFNGKRIAMTGPIFELMHPRASVLTLLEAPKGETSHSSTI